jgi:pimeloyl-ACP methyl ester carboxylesterase
MYSRKKKGSKRGTIILLHGNSSSSKIYNCLFESNIANSLVAFDLPGHGKSGNISSYSFSVLTKLLKDQIALENEPLLIVGTSLGGHLALEILPDIEDAKGIVIIGTPPIKKPLNVEEAFIQSESLLTFFDPSPPDEAVNLALNSLIEQSEVPEYMFMDFKETDPKVRADLAVELSQGENVSDQHYIFSNDKRKKFIVHGRNDKIVNHNYLLDLIKNAKNKPEMVEIDNCGHIPSLDKPEIFINKLEEITLDVFR